MSILYEGGDSCFINYLIISISRNCVQSMLDLLSKKKESLFFLKKFQLWNLNGSSCINEVGV